VRCPFVIIILGGRGEAEGEEESDDDDEFEGEGEGEQDGRRGGEGGEKDEDGAGCVST